MLAFLEEGNVQKADHKMLVKPVNLQKIACRCHGASEGQECGKVACLQEIDHYSDNEVV